MVRRGVARLLLALVLLATACTGAGTDQPSGTDDLASNDGSEHARASDEPTPEESRQPSPEPEPHRISVQALIDTTFTGGGLRLRDVLAETGAYTRYAVTYRSQGLRVSGIMNVPAGLARSPCWC